MNLFKVDEGSGKTARDKIVGEENHEVFQNVVTLMTLLNRVYYSPVSLLIEYNNNISMQKLILDKTGINKYTFVINYVEEFPTVATSRKLKSNIKR